MEKEEADEDEDDQDDAEDEETNDKIKEIKRPKRKPDEDESDLDSSRYYLNLSSIMCCVTTASTDLSIWVSLIEGTEDWRIALLSRSDDTSYMRNEGRLLYFESIINILVRTVVFSAAVDLLI